MGLTYTATRRACYAGCMIQGIVTNLSPVLFIIFRTDFGLSYERLGKLILINFVAQLAIDILGVKFVDRFGYRIPMVAANALCATGLVLMGTLPVTISVPYAGLLTATIVGGIGNGLLELTLSPLLDSLPAPENQKASAMSLLHSFYCWGQMIVVLVTTLLLWAAGGSRWYVLPVIWAAFPIANMFLFTRVPLTQTLPFEKRTGIRPLLSAPAFCAMLLLMLCTGAAEITLSQWSSLFAEQALGVTKLWGDIAGPCMFAALMGLGRILYGFMGSKIRLMPFMTAMTALCIACYLVVSLSTIPALSLLACAVCGFSASVMWPGTLSLTSAKFPHGGTAMFALLAVSGSMGCSLGPWLAGLVADNSSGGLNTGLLFTAIFPVIMLFILCTFLALSRRQIEAAHKDKAA